MAACCHGHGASFLVSTMARAFEVGKTTATFLVSVKTVSRNEEKLYKSLGKRVKTNDRKHCNVLARCQKTYSSLIKSFLKLFGFYVKVSLAHVVKYYCVRIRTAGITVKPCCTRTARKHSAFAIKDGRATDARFNQFNRLSEPIETTL